jgi:hypothetical protein
VSHVLKIEGTVNFEEVLTESFKRYKLKYQGTRPDYEINDPNPYVLSIDDDYNVDGNGKSILGINLNYYNGDVNKLINDVNKADNEGGYRGLDGRIKLRKHFSKKEGNVEEWAANKRKARYNNLIENFPYLGKFIRRYKIDGPGGTGVQSKKRAIVK